MQKCLRNALIFPRTSFNDNNNSFNCKINVTELKWSEMTQPIKINLYNNLQTVDGLLAKYILVSENWI